MDRIVISITGHRILSHSQAEKIKPVIKRAIENIQFVEKEENPDLSFTAISPLAEGADTLFANAALSLGLHLRVILPYEHDEYLDDFTTEEKKQEFETLYNNVAPENKNVLNHFKGNEFNQLFLDLGKKVVDECDYLVAVWNEKEGNGKGGTADIFAYAIEKGKKILLINPEREHPFIHYVHEHNYEHFKKKGIDKVSETEHLLNFILNKQREYNDEAVRFHNKYINRWSLSFVLGIVEVLMFSICISYHLSHTAYFLISTIEFLCLLTIIIVIVFGKSKKLHFHYLHNRIISERLRIKRFFCELGLRIFTVSVSPIYFSLKERPEYNILDHTIKSVNLCAYSNWPFEKKKQHLHTELIMNQLHYHEMKKEKFERRNDLYKQIRLLLLILFIVSSCVYYFQTANDYCLHHGVHISSYYPALFHSEIFENTILFLCLFIPPMIAASEALKYLYEWEKIITVSASMAAFFKKRATTLKHIHAEIELEAFLNSINRDMLIENLDWEKYMQAKDDIPT